MNFLIIILITIPVYETKTINYNYCDIQLKFCENKKHVACENSLQIKNKPLNVRIITSDMKSIILDKFNIIRNKIAMGNFIDHETTKSNMIIWNWDDSLAKLADFYMQSTFNLTENNLCYLTDKGQKPYLAQMIVDEILQLNNDNFLFLLVDKLIEFYTRNEHIYSTFFNVSINMVGCSIGYIEIKETNKTIFQCIFNGQEELIMLKHDYLLSLNDTPCSKCDTWNMTCNKNYPGLCGKTEYNIIESLNNIRALRLDADDEEEEEHVVDDNDNRVHFSLKSFKYRFIHSIDYVIEKPIIWCPLLGILYLILLFVSGCIFTRLIKCYNTLCVCCLLDVQIKTRKNKRYQHNGTKRVAPQPPKTTQKSVTPVKETTKF